MSRGFGYGLSLTVLLPVAFAPAAAPPPQSEPSRRPQASLQITQIGVAPVRPFVGDRVTVTARVKNTGSRPTAAGVKLFLSVNGRELAQHPLRRLAPNAEVTHAFPPTVLASMTRACYVLNLEAEPAATTNLGAPHRTCVTPRSRVRRVPGAAQPEPQRSPGTQAEAPDAGPTPKLLSSEVRGASLELVIGNTARGAETPASRIELRLAGKVVGRALSPPVGPGEEQRLVLGFTIPRGTRSPVDLEIFADGKRLGVERVRDPSIGPGVGKVTPLDLKPKTLRLNGSLVDIQVPKNQLLTAAWNVDPAQAGTATGMRVRTAESFTPDDCATPGTLISGSGYQAGLTGSVVVDISGAPYELGKTYRAKGCLSDINGAMQVTGDETNTVAFNISPPDYDVTEIKVIGGKTYPLAAYIDYWFAPGQSVTVEATVRNSGSTAPTSETITLRPRLDFVPGPGEEPSSAPAGEDKMPGPAGGQSLQKFVGFKAPSREGLYMVRMAIAGHGPPKGAYFGNSLILVQGEGPVLRIRAGRVFVNPKCSSRRDDGLRIRRVGLTPCTDSPDVARVKVQNVGLKASGPFKVVITDTSASGCNGSITVSMPAIGSQKSAWSDAGGFNDTAVFGQHNCGGPYAASIAPAPDGSPDIVFTNFVIFLSRGSGDFDTLESYLER